MFLVLSVQKTCGMSTSVNCTYFVNPNFPSGCSADAGKCSFTVWPCGDGICQLRLDFIEFNIAPPDANGNCNNDFFLVSGAASNVPKICGLNTGEHGKVPMSFPLYIYICSSVVRKLA